MSCRYEVARNETRATPHSHASAIRHNVTVWYCALTRSRLEANLHAHTRTRTRTHTHARARTRTHTHAHAHTHTHTHPFNGPLSRTTRMSWYQKVNPIWILLKHHLIECNCQNVFAALVSNTQCATRTTLLTLVTAAAVCDGTGYQSALRRRLGARSI